MRRIVDLGAVAAGGIEWAPWREGIEIHPLYGDPQSGPSAALLRYAPNAAVPLHEHAGYETVIVLEGEQEDEMGRYAAGTLITNEPGTRHSVSAPRGCVVLVIWEKPVRLLGDPDAR